MKIVSLQQRLHQLNLLTEAQLHEAATIQGQKGLSFVETVIEQKWLDKTVLMNEYAQLLELFYVDLNNYQLKSLVGDQLLEQQARHYQALVLGQAENASKLVGFCDPMNQDDQVAVEEILGAPITPCLIAPDDFNATLKKLFKSQAKLLTSINTIERETANSNQQDLPESQDNSAVSKFVFELVQRAVDEGATDIHIEAKESGFSIRHRVDGVLRSLVESSKSVAEPLIIRLKIMARLNIADTRLPQDGHISLCLQDKDIDLRMATLPTPLGESVVLRILDRGENLLQLNRLCMPEETYQKVKQAVVRPHGLFLVTGPTGSGKTTTLYSMINSLDHQQIKIITAEDPVEYLLPGITQVQVKPKIDLHFSTVLRATLRNDPDVLLVGETRDEETTQQVLRAAITGHMVFSTVHVNNAIDAVARLHDLQADLFSLGSCLVGILNQRLVRKLCQHCKQIAEPSVLEQQWLARHAGDSWQNKNYCRAQGCLLCDQTGYSGRQGLYELYLPSQQALVALLDRDLAQYIKVAQQAMRGKLLIDDGLRLLNEHLTSTAELMRVLGD